MSPTEREKFHFRPPLGFSTGSVWDARTKTFRFEAPRARHRRRRPRVRRDRAALPLLRSPDGAKLRRTFERCGRFPAAGISPAGGISRDAAARGHGHSLWRWAWHDSRRHVDSAATFGQLRARSLFPGKIRAATRAGAKKNSAHRTRFDVLLHHAASRRPLLREKLRAPPSRRSAAHVSVDLPAGPLDPFGRRRFFWR